MKLFFDTNIVLDIVQRRQPFNNSAELLFEHARDNDIEIIVSALSMANINYILEKKAVKITPRFTLEIIYRSFKCGDLNCNIIEKALKDSSFIDFEDCLQHYIALDNKCKFIITRDGKGFKNSQIPVFTASGYLKTIK